MTESTDSVSSSDRSPAGPSQSPADGSTARTVTRARRVHPATIVAWIVVAVVVIALPFQLQAFRVNQMSAWMTIAIAALGLNLLTGFNGQISVGHGALFGVGAYTAGLMIIKVHSPLLVAVLAAGVVCFIVGVLVGLPALRIRGLYLALVTLAVATLFPLAVEQFNSLTGGNRGLEIRTEQMSSRGFMKMLPVRLASPFEGLADDQWQYFLFLAATVICLLLTRNLIKSRVGRSLVAVRDNETAAAVSGVPVAQTKIITFGIGSALAGIGGALFAIDLGQIYPSSFTIVISIYFLVAVVVGGAASTVGPVIGAVLYGVFSDVVIPELPDRLQPARAVILGVLLIFLMLAAPGGLVGVFKSTKAKMTIRKAAKAASANAAA